MLVLSNNIQQDLSITEARTSIKNSVNPEDIR